jgi:hypothetical protein
MGAGVLALLLVDVRHTAQIELPPVSPWPRSSYLSSPRPISGPLALLGALWHGQRPLRHVFLRYHPGFSGARGAALAQLH